MEWHCWPAGDAPHREGLLLTPSPRTTEAQLLRLTYAAGFGLRVFTSPSSRQVLRPFTPTLPFVSGPTRVGLAGRPSSHLPLLHPLPARSAFFLIRGLCLLASRYCEKPGDLRVLVLRAERLSVFLSCNLSSEMCSLVAWISR